MEIKKYSLLRFRRKEGKSFLTEGLVRWCKENNKTCYVYSPGKVTKHLKSGEVVVEEFK